MKVARAIGTRDFYKSYSYKMKLNGLKPMPYSRYLKILKAMGNVYQDCIVNTGITGLPYALGDIMVVTQNGNAPLRVTTTNGVVTQKRMFNDHSEGLSKKIYWLSPDIKKRKGKSWLFSACRSLKRSVSAALYAGKTYPDYLKILKT